MKSRFFIIFATLLLLSACGQSPDVRVESGVRKDPIPNDEQVAAAKNGSLVCDRASECEPAVALISVATASGLSRCTGFLIDDSHVLSNSHCLPESVVESDRCSEYAFIHFAGDLHRTCKKVTIRSRSTDPAFQDYVILELDRPVKDVQPMRLSRRGFRNREKSVLIRVNMTQDEATGIYGGIQSRANCEASYQTLFATNIRSSLSPVMTFGDCPVRHGYSGAPFINSNGEVGAMVQANLSVSSDTVRDQIRKFLLDEDYGDIAYSTQIRCVRDLVGTTALACSSEGPFQSSTPEGFLRAHQVFDASSLLPNPSSQAFWSELNSTSSDEYQKGFVMLPKCISLKEAQSPSFSIISTLISYRLGLNRFLQSEWRMRGKMGDRQVVFVSSKRNAPQTNYPLNELEMTSKEVGKVILPVCKK